MAKPTIITVHGIYQSGSGWGTVEVLTGPLLSAGFRVVNFEYGWISATWHYLVNETLAKRLATYAAACPGDVIVMTHSNGAAIADVASKLPGSRITGLILINPALGRDIEPGPSVRYWTPWWSPSDEAVGWVRWFFFGNWGDMGEVGYQPKDPTKFDQRCLDRFIVNDQLVGGIDLETALGYSPIGHSDAFYLPGFAGWAVDRVNRMADLLENEHATSPAPADPVAAAGRLRDTSKVARRGQNSPRRRRHAG